MPVRGATNPEPAARPSSRLPGGARERVVTAAEAIFSRVGFDGASMRDISAAAGIQKATLYHHFASKDELLWAVWEKGGLELLGRLQDAIAPHADPWRRMEAACAAHVEGLLDWRRANQILFVMPPWQYPESIRDRVIALRDRYEAVFVSLVHALPVRADVDRSYLRLAIIGALSWSLFWFKPGGDPPEAIAASLLSIIRGGVEPAQRSKTKQPRGR